MSISETNLSAKIKVRNRKISKTNHRWITNERIWNGLCIHEIIQNYILYLLSNSPNHHERRFYTTEAVSQRIPKITVFQFQTRSISIDSIQICPGTDIMPPGSFACDDATTWCRIVIYVTSTELVSICICGSVAFYRVSYSLKINKNDLNRANIAKRLTYVK